MNKTYVHEQTGQNLAVWKVTFNLNQLTDWGATWTALLVRRTCKLQLAGISSYITRIYRKTESGEAILHFQLLYFQFSQQKKDGKTGALGLQCLQAPNPNLREAFSPHTRLCHLLLSQINQRTSPDMDWRKLKALGKLQASCHELIHSVHKCKLPQGVEC